jgi:hypothetical protein
MATLYLRRVLFIGPVPRPICLWGKLATGLSCPGQVVLLVSCTWGKFLIYGKISPCGELSVGELSDGRVVQYIGQVHSLWVELSIGQAVYGRDVHWISFSEGEFSVGKITLGRTVHVANCLLCE